MDKYICIHGHFYQPPRENPWLEDVEIQDSAYPYHDWNQRITAECYAPNSSSRILSENGRIKKIVNNYSKISFNFGPTLLDWLEKHEPDVYQAIIESDRKSQENFSGHGSAIAQAYNHMIMPLANKRDKYTQVLWGIWDFEYRFGRKPEGMWLPETGVDLETLDIMAELGISFTILSPYQAHQYRKIGTETWQKIDNSGIDPSMPYKLNIPNSDRSINIFFYDGPISQAVAFEGLLNNGEKFAHRLLSGFSKNRNWPQLVNIATDGETYGHHHRHGEMALAYALQYIESENIANITNYGEFLEKHPPTHEVELVENTAWSCSHGVGRWHFNCGCHTGDPSWNQEWREPLRNALDEIRDTLTPQYEEKASQFLKDPWHARNEYISIILDRSDRNVEDFFAKHSTRPLKDEEKITSLKLLEMQRHSMLMYTSCGWFFNDISGIETVQVIQYAGRVIQLAQDLFDINIENRFLEILSDAKSNIPAHKNGEIIYDKFVRPTKVDLIKVGAHYAISSLFKPYEDKTKIFCYKIHRYDYHNITKKEMKITLGKAKISSMITRESKIITYAAIKPETNILSAGVKDFENEQKYEKLLKDIRNFSERENLSEINHALNTYFNGITYSLKELFKDEQRKITNLMTDSTLWKVEEDIRDIYKRYLPLMRFLSELNTPLPHALKLSAQYTINTDLYRAFLEKRLNFKRIRKLMQEAENWDIQYHEKELSYALKESLDRSAKILEETPTDITLIENIIETTELARELPFEVSLWKIQNVFYKLLNTIYPEIKNKAEHGDNNSQKWLENFCILGDKLNMEIEPPQFYTSPHKEII